MKNGFVFRSPDLIFSNLAEEIVADLENGVAPWVRPWKWEPYVVVAGANEIKDIGWAKNIAGPSLPFGPVNGFILQVRASRKKYRTNFWVTMERLHELKARIKEGEQPCEVNRFYPDQDVRSSSGPRWLYNLDQIEDLDSLGVCVRSSRQHMKDFKFSYKRAKSGLGCLRPELNIRSGKKASYYPRIDSVEMPEIWQFVQESKADRREHREQEGEAHYWATLWHEVVHWTGHSSRLKRPSLMNRGKDLYAREELIAEFGSAFLCSHFGIRGELQYASYIDSWLQDLKSGNRGEVLRESIEQASMAWKWVIDRINMEQRRRKQGEYTVVEEFPH